jgi:V/A-type H+-transporting ATPase subunit I
LPLVPCSFPSVSANILEAQLKESEALAENTSKELLSLTNCIDDLNAQKEELFNNLDLYLANGASVKKADNTIVIFEAFAPTEIDSQVTAFLEENNVYYLKEAAKEEDNPPIKLKNNFFAKLYEPIGELYMLPKYGELDLTMFYAPFYMLFFGFCLGDMGYGLVLILAGLFVNFKVKAFANYGKLIAWLGLGTVIMPAFSGTVFGAKLYELVPLPQNITEFFFNDMQMFWFAILFGIFQIVVARLIQCVYNIIKKNYRVGLNALGWGMAISWATLAYASSEAGFTYPAWVNYIGYASLALIVLCGSDAKNPIVRIVKGTFTLYDSTSVFGDVLSYIRLFGLATSGGILGFVINSISMTLGEVPYIGWLLMIIMLIIGHIFVMLLSSLGAFVHPLRLTFIEFYKNAGFEGGGRAYNPLKKK